MTHTSLGKAGGGASGGVLPPTEWDVVRAWHLRVGDVYALMPEGVIARDWHWHLIKSIGPERDEPVGKRKYPAPPCLRIEHVSERWPEVVFASCKVAVARRPDRPSRARVCEMCG